MTQSLAARQQLTTEGFERLEEELERLCGPAKWEIAERLRLARETPGDQSDNLELLEARRDFELLEIRTLELERTLADAIVVENSGASQATVGSRVLLRDEAGELESFVLVGPAGANPNAGRLSVIAPVGRALLGASKNDEVVVDTPSGHRKLKVLEVA